MEMNNIRAIHQLEILRQRQDSTDSTGMSFIWNYVHDFSQFSGFGDALDMSLAELSLATKPLGRRKRCAASGAGEGSSGSTWL